MQNAPAYRCPLREETRKRFEQLVIQKFGSKRGYISRAAEAVSCHKGNMSAMLNGQITVAMHYVDRLNALPDHVEEITVTPGLDRQPLKTEIPLSLKAETYNILKHVMRYHTAGHAEPPMSVAAVNRMIDTLIVNYYLNVQGEPAFRDMMRSQMSAQAGTEVEVDPLS